MSKGLLAEWRRGIVARGLAASLLLAVPVAVAAAIGFEGSLAGLSQGLTALASGPDDSQGTPQTGPDTIDAAITAIAGSADPTTPAGGTPGGGGNGDDGGGGPPGPEPAAPVGNAPGGSGGGSGGGNTTAIDPPDVGVPNSNPVADLIDGVGESVGGLLGG